MHIGVRRGPEGNTVIVVVTLADGLNERDR
jgi:hypothetical protein